MKHNQPQDITIKKISKELIGTLVFKAITKAQEKTANQKYHFTNHFNARISSLVDRYNYLYDNKQKRSELFDIFNLINSLKNINEPFLFANTIILINKKLKQAEKTI